MRGRHDPCTDAGIRGRASPTDHPLRTKVVADEALERSAEFDGMYRMPSVGTAGTSAEGIAAHLSLLGRSERARSSNTTCCVGSTLWSVASTLRVFTKNRRRLLEHRIGQALFDEVAVESMQIGRGCCQLSTSVWTGPIEAAASIKSFRRRDEGQRPPDDDPSIGGLSWRAQEQPHQSRTDPEAPDAKGKEALVS